nr:hypothetical protein [Alteromonas aestuariivivens]
MVVMIAPQVNFLSGFVQATEPILIQTGVAEFPVEAFHEGILYWLSGLNEVEFDLPFLRPKEHRLTGEFGPVVTDYRSRTFSLAHEFGQKTGYPVAVSNSPKLRQI